MPLPRGHHRRWALCGPSRHRSSRGANRSAPYSACCRRRHGRRIIHSLFPDHRRHPNPHRCYQNRQNSRWTWASCSECPSASSGQFPSPASAFPLPAACAPAGGRTGWCRRSSVRRPFSPCRPGRLSFPSPSGWRKETRSGFYPWRRGRSSPENRPNIPSCLRC